MNEPDRVFPDLATAKETTDLEDLIGRDISVESILKSRRMLKKMLRGRGYAHLEDEDVKL